MLEGKKMNNLIINKRQKKSNRPDYDMLQNIIFMIRMAWKNRKTVLLLCILTALLYVGLSITKLLAMPVILAAIEEGVTLEKLIFTIFIFIGALSFLHTAHSYFSTIIPFEHNSFRIIIASYITQKIVKASYPLTENQDVLKKLDRANMYNIGNDSTTLAFWIKLSELIKNVLGLIIYFVLFSYLEWQIIFVILFTTILGFFVNKHISKWSYIHRNEEAELSQRMNYISNKVGMGSFVKDIRLFNMDKWLEAIYSRTLTLYQAFAAREQGKYIQGDLVDAILSFVRNGVAYIYLIEQVLTNRISASEFLLLLTAVGGITTWISGTLSIITDLHKDSLEISTLREFLEYPEIFQFEEGESIQWDKKTAYQIELKNVSFRYPNTKHYVLKNINLVIHHGEKLAVVGLNGAGKTTLVKLICGFYDPTEGEVLLNGVNIKRYNRRDYYQFFTAVFQDVSILPISISENISQTFTNIDMNKVYECAKKAGLSKTIEKLSKQYETRLGKELYDDGIELSGGETQRLLLARALYKDAPFIILDEPTSALDPIAESEIYKMYHTLTNNQLSVYISHRLASTRFCDRIILIGENTILEEGTHDELIRKKGKYYELFEIQSHYYREDNIRGKKNVDEGGANIVQK